jgi:hypothetical protein
MRFDENQFGRLCKKKTNFWFGENAQQRMKIAV